MILAVDVHYTEPGAMHGRHRLPTLLKAADHTCRHAAH